MALDKSALVELPEHGIAYQGQPDTRSRISRYSEM